MGLPECGWEKLKAGNLKIFRIAANIFYLGERKKLDGYR